MLIVFGGLPGTGKTTLAKKVAERLHAVYLRIDTVETVFKKFGPLAGPEGYMVCYAVAADNLKLGRSVVADSVNPIALTRDEWRKVAMDANVKLIEIEIICSNVKEHQNRIETRKADIPGHKLPGWDDVLNREYEPWESKTLTIDTSKDNLDESVELICQALK